MCVTIAVLASIVIASLHLTAVPAASVASSVQCLTQKMLNSCVTAATGAEVIACGGAADGAGAATTGTNLTEVVLDWNGNILTPRATLKLQLSRTVNRLNLVLLDLKGIDLCTKKSSAVQMEIVHGMAAQGPRIAVRGLSISSVQTLILNGNLAINSHLLSGLPNLATLVVIKNNVTVSSEPLAQYAVSGAPALTSITIDGSIHSVAYPTPLVEQLEYLTSLKLINGNMMLLKPGVFSGLPLLRYLYLSNNNIIELAPGSLSSLTALQHLYLNLNNLQRLTNFIFADLVGLKQLNLADNRLAELEPNTLNGLRNLEFIDLSNNQLTRLPEILFAQQAGLLTLRLNGNRNLHPVNDTFCPLKGLQKVISDGQIECNRFGSARFNMMTWQPISRKEYVCDITDLKVEQRPCFNWVERLAVKSLAGTANEMPVVANTKQQTPTRLSIILLIIFGIICFIHIVTTVVTICVCRRMRQRRRATLGLISVRKSPSVSSPEEEHSLNASSGVTSGKESASVLATKFHSSGNGGSSGKKDKGATTRLNVREKSYDFNEDETPRA